MHWKRGHWMKAVDLTIRHSAKKILKKWPLTATISPISGELKNLVTGACLSERLIWNKIKQNRQSYQWRKSRLTIKMFTFSKFYTKMGKVNGRVTPSIELILGKEFNWKKWFFVTDSKRKKVYKCQLEDHVLMVT